MIGIYEVDRSGDTDRMSILGSTTWLGAVEPIDIRLMSEWRVKKERKGDGRIVQHKAFVKAPTSADGATHDEHVEYDGWKECHVNLLLPDLGDLTRGIYGKRQWSLKI